jgi:HrpA-like RNA helicase
MGMNDSDISEILTGLVDKQVAVVEAGTGTGKSTLMPFRLMNPPPGAPLRLNDFGPIVVTEPRKAAATGVARFVGEAMCFGCDPKACGSHIGPGFPVGYQVSGDRNWDAGCQLIYVTDGTMINWVREGRLAGMSAVIVDEAHERSENIDIILAQLRDQVARHKHLRVVITSATMDKDFFIEFFGGSEAVHYQFIEAKKSFGYGVPFFIGADINDRVIENGLVVGPVGAGTGHTFEGWNKLGPHVHGEDREDLRATTRHLRDLRVGDAIPVERWKDEMPGALATQVVEIAAGTEYGDILGFLPTTNAINEAVSAIEGELEARSLDFDVYPLLSTVPAETRDKAIEARARGDRRKIVVSSNLAETSLTVKGVRFVVDSGLICQSAWDPALANGSFPTRPHSQSGVRQRWGRVGRDAPGWVFPLYTIEQFAALPMNTPPGSTQTNLESYFMKLLAAGLDLDEIELPSNFTHPAVELDEDARQNIDTFNAESERARRALALSGATDSEGHLTEFGRELERFPGTGAEAMALMLSDQLACVHEVALALALLGEGGLAGHRQEIFRVSRSWPAAWRVHAARCHRGLVAGCEDDLDILVRIFSEWQAQDDPDAWCGQWWLNGDALRAAEAAVSEAVSTLSAGMKSGAMRSLRPELVGRARAVITRAMASARRMRLDDRSYVPPGATGAEALELSRSLLVDPGEEIVVMSSFRLPPAPAGGKEMPALITSAVRSAEWVSPGEAGSDDLGFDLILEAARQLRGQDGDLVASEDPLIAVKRQYAVGVALDITVGERIDFTRAPHSHAYLSACEGGAEAFGYALLSVEPASPAFSFPGDPSERGEDGESPGLSLQPRSRRRAGLAGFDESWDPFTNPDPQIPEEEAAQALGDVTKMEINDESPSQVDTEHVSALPARRDPDPGPPGLPAEPLVRSEGAALVPGQPARVVVLGYELTRDAVPVLVVGSIARQGVPGDPAQHPDLNYGDPIEVEVGARVRDHDTEFLQLARGDGRGDFYLRTRTPGLDANDREFLIRLRPGTKLSARVIPGWQHGELSVSLLPAAHEHLAEAPAEHHDAFGRPAEFLEATIVEPPNQWGKVVVELGYSDKKAGLIHRFEVKPERTMGWGDMCSDKGQRLLVALEPDRSRYRKSLPVISESCLAIAESHESSLEVVDGELRAASPGLPLEVVQSLLSADQTEDWRRRVWMFFADSHHLRVAAVRPVSIRARLRVPAETATLLTPRYIEIAQRRGVFVSVAPGGTGEIVGSDPEAIRAAASEIQALGALPYVLAALPADGVGRVIGRGGENIKRLTRRPGIAGVEIDGVRTLVYGEDEQQVIRLVEDLGRTVTSARGTMVVPVGKNGLIIGRGGSVIQSLRESTGCRANNPDRGTHWTIEGPNEDAVRDFIRRATSRAPGTTGRVVSSTTLTILANTATRSARLIAPRPGGVIETRSASRSGCSTALAAGGMLLAVALMASTRAPDWLQRGRVFVGETLGLAAAPAGNDPALFARDGRPRLCRPSDPAGVKTLDTNWWYSMVVACGPADLGLSPHVGTPLRAFTHVEALDWSDWRRAQNPAPARESPRGARGLIQKILGIATDPAEKSLVLFFRDGRPRLCRPSDSPGAQRLDINWWHSMVVNCDPDDHGFSPDIGTPLRALTSLEALQWLDWRAGRGGIF